MIRLFELILGSPFYDNNSYIDCFHLLGRTPLSHIALHAAVIVVIISSPTSFRVPGHLVTLMQSLYVDQEAQARTEFGNTNSFAIGKGVRQGYILSPYLFNLYSEYIIREAKFDEVETGIKIGSNLINNLRHAPHY
ncbi:retrovirus-related Pol polyprotein from type-1 retrotransposable element R2 [Elysia marginata]|uniref:Retrovirus-related Pol polyprotein from type-1 retrotransposable element R2 n=1 Tax=Elysia marginata TaxID=1093978 RepID=A0AAV4G9V5_9GAST|nr:retrovirus-related Pol polyprotein from type-1 retrotransposable element R2 [Elysia marginata]